MSADETSYAPKSPDLSSFYSAPPAAQPAPHFDQLPPPSHGPVDYNNNHSNIDPGNTNYNAQPNNTGYGYSYLTSSYTPAPPQPALHHQPIKSEYANYPPQAQQHYLPHASDQDASLHQSYGIQPSFHSRDYGQPYVDQNPYPDAPYAAQPYQQSPQDLAPSSPTADAQIKSEMPGRRAAAAAPAPAIDPSPVRTKFPTARIKRIMQADEEVGKVAQQTPIAVGKALEMFMIQMVTKSAEVAKDKGSKRVTASMLKNVVENDEQWDFLREIVSKVENEKEGSRANKAKTESESDEEMPEPPKKKGRGGRRKKTE